MAEEKARVIKWDNVKLVLIILVVVGHMMKRQAGVSQAAQRLYYFIYLFHMPAFIFVSGLFAKSVINKRDHDRVFGYFLLYLFIKFLNYFEGMAVSAGETLSLFSEVGVSWYALALCAWYLATMFIKKYDRKYMMILAVIMGCIMGYAGDVGSFLSLSRIFVFYPFFLLGYYLEPESVAAFSGKPAVRMISVAVLILSALIYFKYGVKLAWLNTLMLGRSSYSRLKYFSDAGALLRLFHYLIGGLLTLAVISLVSSRKLPVSYIGQRTLSVYAFHMAFIEIFLDGLHGDEFLRGLWPSHYQIFLILYALLLVLVLSLKPFDAVVRRIIIPKRRK